MLQRTQAPVNSQAEECMPQARAKTILEGTALPRSISTFYKHGWVCPMCLGNKKKPTVPSDASRISHDTGISELPAGPLVT